jgi:hypothetical protein
MLGDVGGACKDGVEEKAQGKVERLGQNSTWREKKDESSDFRGWEPHRLKQSKVDGDKDGDKDGIGAWSRCGLSARLGHGYKGIQRRFGHLATCAFAFCVVVGAFGSSCCSAVHCVLQIG